MDNSNIKLRLILMNFLQFAAWGAYLTSMGRYLANIGFASEIGNFYATLGFVSLFMPALMGIVADKWIPAQRLLGLCHAVSGLAMLALVVYAERAGEVEYSAFFGLYTLSVAFYMPTLAISNSVAYSALERNGLDLVKTFPPIRVFGTVGFIVTMISVDLLGFQDSSLQFAVSGIISLALALYAQTLPSVPVAPKGKGKGLIEALGLKAFSLFRQRKMALFFIFSMLLGVSLQITNGFANPYLADFGKVPEFAGTFGVEHSNILIALSQTSETLCILLIPFALRRFGIKSVMFIAMSAWVLRFFLLGAGDPGSGVWMLVLSMIVYGIAFDFFNVSGSLFVDNETDHDIRSSAQGLFLIMTNGIGATLGSLVAQEVINHFVTPIEDPITRLEGWQTSWYIFAAYALVVAALFALLFQYQHTPEQEGQAQTT